MPSGLLDGWIDAGGLARWQEQVEALRCQLEGKESELTSKAAEIAALHSDFQERLEYVDEVAKQQVAAQQAQSAGQHHLIPSSFDGASSSSRCARMLLESSIMTEHACLLCREHQDAGARS